MKFDLVIIGSGPGGYVAAIRASQLGLKTAIVEKAEPGGVCLNWGCIPTKSLLKSAQVFEYLKHAEDYGIAIEGKTSANFSKMVARSREVAANMSKGIQFLFKKNKIELITGRGKIIKTGVVEVTEDNGAKKELNAKNIIIATGARSRELPNLPIDNKKIIGYRQALTLNKQPKTMLVVGSGAIGSEFAYFYNSIGTQVTLVEYMPTVLPLEDEEVSKALERSFKKGKMKVLTKSTVESVDTTGKNCKVKVKTEKGTEEIVVDIVLSAVGITPNLEDIGIEELGIELDNGKVKVDSFYKTNVEGIYAIGDIVAGPALAHVASAEGITCVEKIAGLLPDPVDYSNVPGCTYTSPEVSSVGITEKQAKDSGIEIRIGKFPYTASGKAAAAGNKEGFIKLIFDAKYGELLGAHMIGLNVTEMISEMVVSRKLETTGHELIKSIHPHPTMSEAIMEAAAAAYGEVIHI